MAPWDVIVPYATSLSDEMGKTIDAPRILRDYSRILSLIKAVTVLRHTHRQVNKDGRLIATVDDYKYVRNLINEMYESSLSGATKEMRNIVEEVNKINKEYKGPIRVEDIRNRLGFTKTQAHRYVKRAIDAGFLINRETRKSYPYNIAVGEPLPVQSGLPAPELLATMGCTVSALTDSITPTNIIDRPSDVMEF
jgi:hypothetical protein